jgi:hypothetical protein
MMMMMMMMMVIIMISYPKKCDQMKELQAFWWGLD